jgi:hypothetical protein
MDEENNGSTGAPEQDPNANVQPIPTGATASTDTTSTLGEGVEMAPLSGTIVDKSLSEIASGVVKTVEGDIKGTVDTDVAKVETKVNHEAHGILDELEAHLSQFDARAVAIYHSFLNRLRNAI